MPCRRARINTWAAYVKTQGMLALARGVAGAVGGSRSRATVSTASSGHSPLTYDGDLDADSVFDSPPAFALTVMNHEEGLTLQVPGGGYVGPASDCGSQDDLLHLPLQDPAEAYASPDPTTFFSHQDLLSLPPSSAAAPPVPGGLQGHQYDLLALPDFGGEFSSPGLQVGPYPSARSLDRRKGDDLFYSELRLDRQRVCAAQGAARTSRKLERYLSEPHPASQPGDHASAVPCAPREFLLR